MREVTRPEATVLPDSALVPDSRMLKPPPNQFTHLASGDAPFWYSDPAESAPAGTFAAGTPLVLLRRDGQTCWVADAQGLYVAMDFARLRAR